MIRMAVPDSWMVRAVRNALPVIVFFMASFFLILSVFGLHYTVVAPPMAALFGVWRGKRDEGALRYLLLAFHELLLLSLSAIGAGNALLLAAVNIIVPFIIVFTQSSQFSPRGYYAYMLLFVYLSFKPPVNGEEFSGMLLSMWMSTAVMAAMISFMHARRRSVKAITVAGVLSELSVLTSILPDRSRTDELSAGFASLMHDVSSGRRRFSALRTKDSKLGDMVSTLMQRFSFMISDTDWHAELDAARKDEIRKLSSFLAEASLSVAEGRYDEGRDSCHYLLDTMEIPDGHVRIFIRSILHMTLFIFDTLASEEGRLRRIDWRNIRHEMLMRLSSESFEMRYATRLAAVMVLSGLADCFLPLPHTYWISFNAFMLIKPEADDSVHSMRVNPLGTIAGCIAEYIIYPFLPGIWGELCFALIMISLMYCSDPGSWFNPAFQTCYTLTIALMTAEENTAIALRLLYLLVAIVIVFMVNRLFFPIRPQSQFSCSLRALTGLHAGYWNVIRHALEAEADLSVSASMLTEFHMHYTDCLRYISEHPESFSSSRLPEALLMLWKMFSSLEQLHYLIRARGIRGMDDPMLAVVATIQERLDPLLGRKDLPAIYDALPALDADEAYIIRGYLMKTEKLLDCSPGILF